MTKFQRMGLGFYLMAITFDAQGLAGNILEFVCGMLGWYLLCMKEA